jgi:hypothetical protein
VILALLLLSIVPRDDVARETVDLAEVNHHYDENGRWVFDQVIFYDWSPGDERYTVRAWRLVKNPNILPQRDWERGGYRSLWYDGGVLRNIHALSFRETWSQTDPELVERLYLPKERRKELRTTRKKCPVSSSSPASTTTP